MAKLKYNDDFPLLAEGMAREGMIDVEIAAALGISKDTFYQYQKKYPDFYDSIKRGKAPVDVRAENSLLKRVEGYEFEETHIEYEAVKKGEKASAKKVKKITKQMAPDVTACIFWLKNRKPKEWRDRHNVELSGEDGEPVKIEYVPVKKREKK